MLLGDSNPRVLHLDHTISLCFPGPYGNRALFRIFDGVIHQIHEQLFQLIRLTPNLHVLLNLPENIQILLADLAVQHFQHLGCDLLHGNLLQRFLLPRSIFNLRQIQNILNQPVQTIRFHLDDVKKSVGHSPILHRPLFQGINESPNRGERRL